MKTFIPLIFSFFLILSCKVSVNESGIKGNGDIITITRAIDSEFNKLELQGPFDIIVEDGINSGEAKITGDSNLLEYVDVTVENSTLIVRKRGTEHINFRKPITVSLTAKNLAAVTVKGSGDIDIQTIQHSHDFTAEIKGSGDINVNIQSDMITAKIKGSGDITLKGGANSLKALVEGSGDINAFDLATGTAEANIAGSGDISITVFESLKGEIKGSGDIRYKGDIMRKDVNKRGSGDLIKVDY